MAMNTKRHLLGKEGKEERCAYKFQARKLFLGWGKEGVKSECETSARSDQRLFSEGSPSKLASTFPCASRTLVAIAGDRTLSPVEEVRNF